MTSSLYVTYLEKEGPYIKIWGQTNRSLPMSIEKTLQQMTPQFEEGMFLPSVEYFQVGLLCCAKFKDGSYYRARITNINYVMQGMIEVLFIDYGNKDIIPCINTRTMTSLSPGLISIPPQARPFILANVTLHGWNSNLELISNELRYLEFNMFPLAEIGPYILVSLYLNKQDVTTNLLAHGLVVPTPLHVQQIAIQSLIERTSPPGLSAATLTQAPVVMSAISPKLPPGLPQPIVPAMPVVVPPPAPTILAYKTMPLEHDCDYEVYVSYVSDGPCLFSVQLKKMEEQLKRLMIEINAIDLQPLEEYPLPGTVCLAQSTEDNYICRAVVTSMVDGQYKVFYVDFGNTELLPFDKLFQIPFKYIIPKVMATRFALAGLEQATVSIEMKCAFKDFVNNKLLFMRVKPTTAKSALSLCDLWDDKNRRALDMIRQVALQSYAEPVSVSRGLSQEVKISFVYSCRRFYVQIKSKEAELAQLMDVLQEVCSQSVSTLTQAQTKPGYPCFSLFETDGLWYRAQILKADNNNTFKVRYIDFGNEELVALENLREPISELILTLRPQAIECCLNGYQNMEADEQRDSLLEELILEQEFTMKVVEMQEGRALVDLFDGSHYNVASLLLDKIASVTSQVSPLLVQDDYRIEHRKRTSPQPNFQKEFSRERKPSREFNEKPRENWRQNKFNNLRNEDERNDTNGFDKRDLFRHAISNNEDECETETSNFDRQNSFNRQNSRNDDNKFNRTGRNNNNARNDDHQFEKPRTFERRERPNSRTDNQQQRDKFNNYEKRNNSSRYQDSDKPRRNDDNYQQKSYNKFNNKGFNNDFNGSSATTDSFRQSRRNREGSEKSFSDSSEKSWRKGPKSFSKREKPSTFAPAVVSSAEESWDISTPAVAEVLDLATESAQFKRVEGIIGSTESVNISWFYNPTNFYCQLTKLQNDFKIMMEEIQAKYSSRKTIQPVVGQPVVAKFEEDGVLYRAVVLSAALGKYSVIYVDYGNLENVSSVYAIETKHMDMPAQAVNCALQSIGPSGDTWPDPDVFSSYFSKDSFECQFINEADERFFVELSHESVRISTLLIEASLAVSLQPVIELDVFLLLSQQIIVVLQDVGSLLDITVALEPNLTIKVAAHNLQNANEIYVESLKEFIGHYVIMYVDEVTDEGLQVTFYDLTGQKIEIVNPDEGAYESVDPVCALPIYSKTLQGWVSHATADALYIQPSRYAETLAQVLDQLYNHYEAALVDNSLTPEIGGLYAVHSGDTNWYRGRITDVTGENEAFTVTYIDYGNSETVGVTDFRNLHPKFYQPHMLACEISIEDGNCENFVGQELQVSVEYGENGWIGRVIAAPSVKASEELVVTEAQEAPVVIEAEETTAPPEIIGVAVVMSHIDSPSEFYLQLVEAVEAVELLQENLQEQIPNLADLENRTPGVLCAAPYSVNQQWYRAQILDADDDITTVRFIDFGNTDVISNVDTSIKTLPSDLLSIEQHARLCSLFAQPVGAEWSNEALTKFEEYSYSECLSAEILHQDEKTTYVDLYANGKNVADVLKADGFAVDLQLETENNSTGFISHLNSPSEFWIQLESSVPDLEWVAEQLSSANNYPVLEDVAPGALCAAVFSGDDSWYRARILSNTVAGLEVIFVDYGNSCSCTNVRELPEDLIMLPPLAHKCSLQRPPGILQWSQAAADEFRKISADGATVFDVSILTPGEKSIVQLILDGEDVSNQLLPETKDCIVSHIDSLDSIWIVMNEDTKKLEELTEILYQAETWSELSEVKEGDLVAALYEDGLWYRARVLNKAEDDLLDVVFVDYGNATRTQIFRELNEACQELPPLAVNYKIDELPQTKWAEDSLEKFSELSAEGSTVFQMELVGENCVRLYLDGRDVRLEIGTVKISPSTSRQNTPQKVRQDAVMATANDEEVLMVAKFENEKDIAAKETTNDEEVLDDGSAEEEEEEESDFEVDDDSSVNEIIERVASEENVASQIVINETDFQNKDDVAETVKKVMGDVAENERQLLTLEVDKLMPDEKETGNAETVNQAEKLAAQNVTEAAKIQDTEKNVGETVTQLTATELEDEAGQLIDRNVTAETVTQLTTTEVVEAEARKLTGTETVNELSPKKNLSSKAEHVTQLAITEAETRKLTGAGMTETVNESSPKKNVSDNAETVTQLTTIEVVEAEAGKLTCTSVVETDNELSPKKNVAETVIQLTETEAERKTTEAATQLSIETKEEKKAKTVTQLAAAENEADTEKLKEAVTEIAETVNQLSTTNEEAQGNVAESVSQLTAEVEKLTSKTITETVTHSLTAKPEGQQEIAEISAQLPETKNKTEAEKLISKKVRKIAETVNQLSTTKTEDQEAEGNVCQLLSMKTEITETVNLLSPLAESAKSATDSHIIDRKSEVFSSPISEASSEEFVDAKDTTTDLSIMSPETTETDANSEAGGCSEHSPPKEDDDKQRRVNRENADFVIKLSKKEDGTEEEL